LFIFGEKKYIVFLLFITCLICSKNYQTIAKIFFAKSFEYHIYIPTWVLSNNHVCICT
jgi:hypothetical protein